MLRELTKTRELLPAADRTYPLLLITHLAFFILTPLEVLFLHRTFVPALGIAMAALYVGATLLRWWSTSLLAAHWSSRVAVPGDLVPVTGGPYRVIRHPNYLAMSFELLAAGLFHSAWLSTAIVTLLNIAAITIRIREEESALFQIPAYRAKMDKTARLIPGVY
jgi:methyltransferase